MSELPRSPGAALGFEASERPLATHVQEFLRILEEERAPPDLEEFCRRAPPSLRLQLRDRCIDVRSIKRLLPARPAGKTTTPPSVQPNTGSRRARNLEC